jgi:spore coat protein U-like protein
MKRFLASLRLLTLLSTMAVVFSWSPRESAEALTTDNARLVIGVRTDDSCLMITTRVNFPNYDIESPTADDGTGNIHLNCTMSVVGAIMHLRLGQGGNPAAGSTAANPRRRMTNGTDMLSYDLYRDAGRARRWGDTLGSGVFPAAGATFPLDIPVYGRIPALQVVTPGAYADSVLVTVYY